MKTSIALLLMTTIAWAQSTTQETTQYSTGPSTPNQRLMQWKVEHMKEMQAQRIQFCSQNPDKCSDGKQH